MTKTELKDWFGWYWPWLALAACVIALIGFGIADGSLGL